MVEVDVWYGRLDIAMAQVERLKQLLSLPEQARAGRFRYARDRRRFIVRRARLRQCLAVRTGIAPERLTFAVGQNGKPRLAGDGQPFNAPCFSLSHSGDYWLLAIADVEVGADIEQMAPGIDHHDTARGLFGAGEIKALEGLPEMAAMSAFFQCWARKEAFVKAIGEGLSYPLDAFEVSVGADAMLLSGGEGWAMERLDIAADVAGAIVARADGRPLDIRMAGFDAVRDAA